VEASIGEGEKDIAAGSRMLKEFNPMAAYERVRSGNLGALTGLTDMLSGVGRRQEAAASARLGLAGRPRSSARDILRSSGLAAGFAPVAGQIFSGLGRDTGILGRQVSEQAGGLKDMAMSRPQLYNQLLKMGLAPLEAEQLALQGEVGALGGLADAVKKNFAGMDVTKKRGIFDYLTDSTGAIAGAAGNLSDAAGSVGGLVSGGSFLGGAISPVMGAMGGAGNFMGGMGNMAGGMGGLMGSITNPNMAAMGRWGGYNPASYGMGRPGAVDVNRMTPAQMAAFEQAQMYGRSNVPAGSTWE